MFFGKEYGQLSTMIKIVKRQFSIFLKTELEKYFYKIIKLNKLLNHKLNKDYYIRKLVFNSITDTLLQVWKSKSIKLTLN